jgi:hypothetical protein
MIMDKMDAHILRLFKMTKKQLFHEVLKLEIQVKKAELLIPRSKRRKY